MDKCRNRGVYSGEMKKQGSLSCFGRRHLNLNDQQQRRGCSSFNSNWAPFSRREATMEADTSERGARMRMRTAYPRLIFRQIFPPSTHPPVSRISRAHSLTRSISLTRLAVN